MFEVMDEAGTPCRVYGIHKSGPLDKQTKFLMWKNGWRWVWAQDYRPVSATTALTFEQPPVDMVVPPIPITALAARAMPQVA